MRINTLKNRFLKLPLPQKLVGIGSFIAFISAVLPWYSDVDMYGSGETYIGVTGPLYLVGFIIILLGVFSLILTGFYLFDKKIPDLPMKESMVYILSGAVSLSLLIIANSVYFHPGFGINITSKIYGIGMMMALIGTIGVLLGGILQHRESGTSRFIKEFEEETRGDEELEEIDPVLELNNFQKEQQEMEERKHKTDVVGEFGDLPLEPDKEPVKSLAQERFEGHKGVREYKAKSDFVAKSAERKAERIDRADTSRTSLYGAAKPSGIGANSSVRREPYPDPSLLKKEASAGSRVASAPRPASPSPAASDEGKVNPNSVIRMDL